MVKRLFLGLLFLSLVMGCASTAYRSAKLYIQQENWDKAIEYLEIEVQQNPKNAEAYYYLGWAYAKKGLFEKMNQAFESCLALSKKREKDIVKVREKYWIDHYNAGVKEIQRERFAIAIGEFKTAVLILPSRIEAYRNLAYAYIKLDSLDNAAETYRKALEIAPNDIDIYLALGSLYYNKQKYQDAIDVLQKVLEQDPTNADAISYTALSYDYLGETEKAMEAYEKALKLDPENKDLRYNLGRLFFKRKNYDRAIPEFERVLQADPEDYDALIQLGMSYLLKAEGIKKHQKELEEKGKAPEDTLKHLEKKARQSYLQAIPYLQKASRMKPLESIIWYNLGVAYINLGENKEGEKAFLISDELKNEAIKQIVKEYGEPDKVYVTKKRGNTYLTFHYQSTGLSLDISKGKIVSKYSTPVKEE